MAATRGEERTIVVHLADQLRHRTDSHGIINFSLGLVSALPGALPTTARLVVLANESIATEIDQAGFRPQDEIRLVGAPPIGATPGRMWLDHVTVGRIATDVGADVVVYPKGFLPARPAPASARHVAVFHDDIATRRWRERSTGWRGRPRAGYFHRLTQHSLARADVRLFVSAFSAHQLTGPGAARPDDAVIGEGISLHAHPHVPLADRVPRVVVFGSTLEHKRIAAGLTVLAPLLPPGLRRVVVIGPAPTLPPDLDLDVEVHAGPMASAELERVIGTSRLLFYPSVYEGFGLPPIEAHALGTPALYRGNAAAVEVLGDRPGRFDAQDSVAVGAALTRALALDDDDLVAIAAEMRARFDWRRVAERVVEAISPGQIP